MIIPIVGSAYKDSSVEVDLQNCVNFYLNSDVTGKFPLNLYPRPGLTLFSAGTASQKEVRELFSMNDMCYAVIDNTLYWLRSTGSREALGTLNTSTGAVTIRVNGKDAMIVDGFFGYVHEYKTGLDANPANIFSDITDADFIPPGTVEFQDGYFLYPQRDSQKIWRTELLDPKNISALSFQSASGRPDNVVALISSHQELWVFCTQTAEVWYNTGDATFPFQRRQTLLIEYGCAAAKSICRGDNGSIIWLSKNEQGKAVVVSTSGYAPQVLSTSAMVFEMGKYETINDAKAFIFQLDSHVFYVLTFPTEDKTWVYDILTKSWSEWGSTISNTSPETEDTHLGRWLPNCFTSFAGKQLVGDYASGNIYQIDTSNHTDNSTYVIRERTTRHFQSELKITSINYLQIDFESAVGEVSGEGELPEVMLQYSKDNGHTWSNEMWRSVGKIGQYGYRVRWNRLGSARDWVFKIRMSDPVKWVIIGAVADIEVEGT